MPCPARPRCGPVELARKSSPERIWIAGRFGVQTLIADHGARAERVGRSKGAILSQEVVNLGVLLVGHDRKDTVRPGGASASGHPAVDLAPERGEPRPNAGDKIRVDHGAEAQEAAVMLDRRGGVATLIGDDGEVVVGARVALVDRQRPSQ